MSWFSAFMNKPLTGNQWTWTVDALNRIQKRLDILEECATVKTHWPDDHEEITKLKCEIVALTEAEKAQAKAIEHLQYVSLEGLEQRIDLKIGAMQTKLSVLENEFKSINFELDNIVEKIRHKPTIKAITKKLRKK